MKTLRTFLVVSLALAGAALASARPAPSWTLKDPSGKAVSSETFKGKVVVVDFWATWCGPCRMEIPGYIELQEKYQDDLVVVGISVDAPPRGASLVKSFVAKNNINYPIVMSTDEVLEAFAGDRPINAIPTTFIIDRDGNIRDRKEGAEHKEEFEQRLLPFLKKPGE